MSLCGFHHRRHHDGVYLIRKGGDTALIFENPDGRRIAPGMQQHTTLGLDPGDIQGTVFAGAVPDPLTAKAKDGGRFDMDHAIMVIAESCRRMQTEAGHSP